MANSVEFWHMAMLFPAKHAKWNFNLIFNFSRLSTCCRRACIGHLIYQIWWQTANKGLLGFYSVDLAVLLVAVLNWLGGMSGSRRPCGHTELRVGLRLKRVVLISQALALEWELDPSKGKLILNLNLYLFKVVLYSYMGEIVLLPFTGSLMHQWSQLNLPFFLEVGRP